MPSADVINLHYVSRFIDLSRFFATYGGKIPLVWRLPDMNPFTGGCHYDGGCGRFASGCGRCPVLDSNCPVDLSRSVYRRKKRIFSGLRPKDLHLVALSRWMRDQIRRSPLFNRFPVSVIPNGLDTKVFSPRGADLARRALGLPEDAMVLFFAANNIADQRKGFRYVRDVVDKLADIKELFLLSAGTGNGRIKGFGRARHLGLVEDERLLSLAYSASNVFLIPSLQDNLPNTVIESLSCGTPVVGFEVGGIPDMVDDGRTGFLVPRGDSAGLTARVKRLLTDRALRQRMSEQCRRIAVQKYSLQRQTEQYLDLYSQLTNRPLQSHLTDRSDLKPSCLDSVRAREKSN
jgi:glycosyltransferase involved in cell wall biosynthesis